MTTYDDKEEKAEAIPEPSAALLELLSPAPGSLIILDQSERVKLIILKVKEHLQEQAEESHSLLY